MSDDQERNRQLEAQVALLKHNLQEEELARDRSLAEIERLRVENERLKGEVETEKSNHATTERSRKTVVQKHADCLKQKADDLQRDSQQRDALKKVKEACEKELETYTKQLVDFALKMANKLQSDVERYAEEDGSIVGEAKKALEKDSTTNGAKRDTAVALLKKLMEIALTAPTRSEQDEGNEKMLQDAKIRVGELLESISDVQGQVQQICKKAKEEDEETKEMRSAIKKIGKSWMKYNEAICNIRGGNAMEAGQGAVGLPKARPSAAYSVPSNAGGKAGLGYAHGNGSSDMAAKMHIAASGPPVPGYSFPFTTPFSTTGVNVEEGAAAGKVVEKGPSSTSNSEEKKRKATAPGVDGQDAKKMKTAEGSGLGAGMAAKSAEMGEDSPSQQAGLGKRKDTEPDQGKIHRFTVETCTPVVNHGLPSLAVAKAYEEAYSTGQGEQAGVLQVIAGDVSAEKGDMPEETQKLSEEQLFAQMTEREIQSENRPDKEGKMRTHAFIKGNGVQWRLYDIHRQPFQRASKIDVVFQYPFVTENGRKVPVHPDSKKITKEVREAAKTAQVGRTIVYFQGTPEEVWNNARKLGFTISVEEGYILKEDVSGAGRLMEVYAVHKEGIFVRGHEEAQKGELKYVGYFLPTQEFMEKTLAEKDKKEGANSGLPAWPAKKDPRPRDEITVVDANKMNPKAPAFKILSAQGIPAEPSISAQAVHNGVHEQVIQAISSLKPGRQIYFDTISPDGKKFTVAYSKMSMDWELAVGNTQGEKAFNTLYTIVQPISIDKDQSGELDFTCNVFGRRIEPAEGKKHAEATIDSIKETYGIRTTAPDKMLPGPQGGRAKYPPTLHVIYKMTFKVTQEQAAKILLAEEDKTNLVSVQSSEKAVADLRNVQEPPNVKEYEAVFDGMDRLVGFLVVENNDNQYFYTLLSYPTGIKGLLCAASP
jgi:hypothetical protein